MKRTSRKRTSRKRTSRKRTSRKRTSRKRMSRKRTSRKRTSRKRMSRKRKTKAGSSSDIFKDETRKDKIDKSKDKSKDKSSESKEKLDIELLTYDYKEGKNVKIIGPSSGKKINADDWVFVIEAGKYEYDENDVGKYNALLISKGTSVKMTLNRPYIVKLEKENEYKIFDTTFHPETMNYITVKIEEKNNIVFLPEKLSDSPQAFIV